MHYIFARTLKFCGDFKIIRVALSSCKLWWIMIVLGLFTGCASTSSTQTTTSPSVQIDPNLKKYTLSEEEMILDCGKLTGRTQVKILSLRGESVKGKPSEASKTLGFITGSIFGTYSASDTSSEIKILEAYNNRLKDLGCKSFDLTKELDNRPTGPLPEPTIQEKAQ